MIMDTFKMHRHINNPKEKEFYDKFLENNDRDMDLIVFGHGSNSFRPLDYLSDREKQIVLSTVQWLGSPVGMGFLNNCGFSAQKEI
jgi:hypothetical protein